MGLLSSMAEVFRYSHDQADMIGQARLVLRRLDTDLKKMHEKDPQKFAALTQEQCVIYVQSQLMKIPGITKEKRLQYIAEARKTFAMIKQSIQ